MPAGGWAKLYGDGEVQRPHKVKAFGDGIYVTGETAVMGQTFGTFTKFDPATGSVIWHFRMNQPSSFSDFEWDPMQDVFILVGGTPTSSTANNTSLAVQVDDTGLAKRQREWDFAGREGFTTIVYHPTAPDPNFPFFVLGGKNPDNNAPSSFDEAVLLNLNILLVDKWEREFNGVPTGTGFTELEAVRGLVPLSTGQLLVLGNGSVANEGVMIIIDAATGDPDNGGSGIYYPDFIDFYDGVELPNGEIALVGERFQSNEAIVLIIEPANYQPVAGMIFSDVRAFKEIGLGNPATNGGDYPLFVIGDLKGGPQAFNYLHKIDYAPGSGISLEYVRHLPATAAGFGDPHLSVVPTRNRITYADSRTDLSAATPTQEMFVGDFSLDFDPECVEDVASPHLGYTVLPTSFLLAFRRKINGPDQISISPFTTPLPFVCNSHCILPPPCSADFSFEVDCCEGVFTSNATGTAPFTYAWDINCDGMPDGIGNVPNFNYTFPGSGVYQVCLTITDATGCSNTVQQRVTVVDDPPVLTCPDVVIPTDLGECFATYQPVIDAMDDCTPTLRPSCTFSGAVSGSGSAIDSFPKGITTVNCAVEDGKGQLATCQFTITVEDREPPKIVCPTAPAPVTVPGCEGGANVVWNDPSFTDNCPMATISSTHEPEDFFPCGTTTVTYTVTDMAGLTTSCSFPVRVICECAEITSEEIRCGAEDNVYDFNFKVNDLTGANPSNCQVTVSSPQAGVNVQNIVFTGGVVRGEINIPAAPIPTTVRLDVRVECFCPDGTSVVCTIPVFLTTPCCKEISIADQEQCRATDEVTIDLIGCNALFDVRQVRYYVSDAPCTPGSPMTLIQVSQDCRPLKLAPQYHNGDVCVYAEVDMGPGAGPCRQLRTDTALVKLCAPVSCSLADQAYCYAGTPIVPSLLTLTVNDPDTCAYTIQWFDANGPIPGETGPTYQPPALSMTTGSTACSESFTFRAEITSICGVQSCSSTIRLDNNDAPIGEIVLHAPDTNPLCYGEDAVLEYVRNCEQPGGRWTWEQRTTSTSFSDITTNGNQNPLYQTNRLYEDQWYRIAEQNGLCPVDTVSYFLDIIDPLVITSFTAVHGPVCAPTQIDMSLDWGPLQAGCTYKIVWYHDGNPIFVETVSGGPRTFSYVPPAGTLLSGNFYAVVSSSCCEEDVKSPVITLDPPLEVLIASPCFRCKADTVLLNGIVLNVPTGITCTYRWYDNGNLLPGETGVDLVVKPEWYGPFTFEVTCTDGCVRTATVDLLQCGPGLSSSNIELLKSEAYPNPSSGTLYIELEKPAEFTQLEVLSISGQVMKTISGSGITNRHELDLSKLPAGIYLVRGIAKTGELLVVKAIKE